MRYILMLSFIVFSPFVYAQQYKTLEKDGHNISSVAFSPNGKLIASGGTDYNVVLWNVSDSTPANLLKGHKDIILATAFSPDGSSLATASQDKTIIIWSVHKGVEEKLLSGHTGAVTSIKFSNDGKFLLSGSTDNTAIIWDVNSGQQKKVIKGHFKGVSSVAISPDESWFATGSFDGEIKLWDMKTFELIRNINPQSGKVMCMATGSSSSHLAAGFENKTVRLIDVLSDGASKTFKGHKNVVYDIEFSPDDKYLASGGLDNLVKVWDIQSGETVCTYSKFFNLVSLHFSPDGKRLATAELNTQLKLWDISSLKIEPVKTTIVSNVKPPIKRSNKGTKPVVEIVQPKIDRSSKFIWLEKEITIKGDIKSENGIYEVLINEQEVVLLNGTSFSHTIKLGFKDNPIIIKVTDTEGNITEQSFIIERQIKVANVNDTLKRQGQDYALVLVSDDYENFNHLTNPINDGSAIAKELQESYGFKPEIVKNPKNAQIYTVLREYSKKVYADDDQLLIFIAGHGEFDEVFKQGYIIFTDSKKGDQSTFLSHANLKTMVDNISCKHILLVMDACFSGTFDPTISRRGSPEEKIYKDIDREKFILKKLEYTTRKYLTSGGKEYVPDGTPGQHSPFARKCLEALRSNGGEDGILTFGEAYSYLEKALPSPHTGEFGSNEPGSDFLFIYKK